MAGMISGAISVVLLVLFVAGWAWAWSGRRKPAFDAAARMPLDDEPASQEAQRDAANGRCDLVRAASSHPTHRAAPSRGNIA